jgi:hypothetical protein
VKLLSSIILILEAFMASAQADIAIDNQVVDVACSQEALIANCGPEKVGEGLLQCLRAYPFSQLSSACEAAIDRFDADKNGSLKPIPGTTIKPTYASPGPGYIWRYEPQYGWGWFHPRFGWHRAFPPMHLGSHQWFRWYHPRFGGHH